MRYDAVVKTRFTALHRWPDAPPEVSFLRDFHRHEFHVTLSCSQEHADRDVEYVTLKRWLDGHLGLWEDSYLGEKSCEMLAEQIIEAAKEEGYSPNLCTVLEDGENGAVVYP